MSGLAFPDGTPGRVLRAVRDGRIEAVASFALARELVEVLDRPRIRALGFSDADVADALTLLAPLLPDVEIEVEPRDPDDAPVVSTALAARAQVIITGDRSLLDDERLGAWLRSHEVDVLAPAAALARLSA